MKTQTWVAAAPRLECTQVTPENAAQIAAWLQAYGAHVIDHTEIGPHYDGFSGFYFTDDNGAHRSPLFGDWVCLDPERQTFRLVDEHVLPTLYRVDNA